MKTYDYTKLKALREERSLTQKDMGDSLGITQSAYNKMETGNRKRKNDSILDIEKLADVLELTPQRLISILTNQNDLSTSGIKNSDLWEIQRILKREPLREDEFVFFTTELIDIHLYDFKKDYTFNISGIENDDLNIPMSEFSKPIKILYADSVDIGFEYTNKKLKQLIVWLGKKKLGAIPEHHNSMIDSLIMELMISRVVLIGNEDSVTGFPDTYMKVVFIASNAICKKSEFAKGRFSKVALMTEEEVKDAEADI